MKSVRSEMFQGVRRGLQGRRALERAAGAGGRPLRVGRLLDVRQEPPLLRRDVGPSPSPSRTSRARAAGPAATASPPTTSRRRARSRCRAPAGRYLIEHGVDVFDFNSYGSRRGNHEVMVRGTFANVRLRNKLAPGTEGIDPAPPRRRGDDDLRGGRALPDGGRSRSSSWRARNTARARRATGRPRGRSSWASAPSSPRATSASTARTSSAWASSRSSSSRARAARRSA